MNVLSLFDGMSTLQLALKNQGFKVENYYASEIKPYAIKLTKYHFPNTIQLGDITKWKEWNIDWKSIDFIGSGSPCQDLSIAGKRAGIKGDRSSLFFTFVEILNHVRQFNQNVLFLQENVGSASKLDIGIMSRALGVYPIRINSNLLTAQNRDRYYWTNIRTKQDGMFGDIVSDIPQPEDKGIMLKDIIESGTIDKDKSNAILQRYGYSFGYKDQLQPNAQKFLKERTKLGMYTSIQENGFLRKLTQTELERLQGFSDGYTSILSYNQAASVLGDGWTLPVIEYILTFINKKNIKY